MTTKLVWITPDAENTIGYIARVSNPANQDNPDVEGLLRYCIRNRHWSPFEMASMCLEINTTRDIARQILRHRSFHFQEFSQRYADASLLGEMVERECRMQDEKNRQNSLPATSQLLRAAWSESQKEIWEKAKRAYGMALQSGIAKEQARALLPEGLTPSRLYMAGTIRDWLHYCDVRCANGTQAEHMTVANEALEILREQVPVVAEAMWPEKM
jgi:thymidylate synthase (FAD)